LLPQAQQQLQAAAQRGKHMRYFVEQHSYSLQACGVNNRISNAHRGRHMVTNMPLGLPTVTGQEVHAECLCASPYEAVHTIVVVCCPAKTCVATVPLVFQVFGFGWGLVTVVPGKALGGCQAGASTQYHAQVCISKSCINVRARLADLKPAKKHQCCSYPTVSDSLVPPLNLIENPCRPWRSGTSSSSPAGPTAAPAAAAARRLHL
jgi:hypothetical protein